MAEKKESSSEERKGREGIPMSEEDVKDWQKVFTDMEEAINNLKGAKYDVRRENY